MRVFLLFTVFLLGALPWLRAERLTQELTSGWKFIKQDVGVTAATSGWETVTIPHTWNATDGRAGNAPTLNENQGLADTGAIANPSLKDGYYRGACWYSRTVDVPSEWKGKRRVFIRFEAASLVARTYINGKLLGEHRGAFTAFLGRRQNFLYHEGEPK